jgi:Protein of unknown function (DUF4230)
MKGGVGVKCLASAMSLAGMMLVPAGMWAFDVPLPWASASVPPPSLAVIQTMSELATTRVHISDVIEGENEHWRGRWSLHGEVVLGVNLGDATYRRTDPQKREATLRLPPPHLVASKVDHERSEELSMTSLSWIGFSDPKRLRDDVWKNADRKIQRLGQEPGHMERAKVQAERTLQSLFQGVGWKVSFEWE